MNKIKMLAYKVVFFNVTTIILVFFAISFMIANQVCSNRWDLYVDKEKKLVSSVQMYQDASDYLTKTVFAYISSGNNRYYKNYMREAYEIKRREAAVYHIKTIGIEKELENLIDRINGYSMELMRLEEESISLLKAGRIEEAKEKLFSGEYQDKADKIASDVKNFERLVRADIKKTLNILSTVINSAFLGEVIIGALIIIISPLRNRIITKLLYMDSLTNIKNRVAFDKDICRYENNIKGLVFLDVNDLKRVNDRLSHKAGDELLINVAGCIKKVFSEYGKCYRISGDEFVVILENEIDETALLDKFNEECTKVSNHLGSKISVSCGFAMQNNKNPISKDEMYMTAEQNMYKAKADYYEKSGNDRRISR